MPSCITVHIIRLTKHVYYPTGVNVNAEKPLIYDKVDTMGPGAGDLTYQTTALSTFRQTQQVDTSSSSEDSSCSALCPPGDTQCHTMQVSDRGFSRDVMTGLCPDHAECRIRPQEARPEHLQLAASTLAPHWLELR